jgi:hypothetical protein
MEKTMIEHSIENLMTIIQEGASCIIFVYEQITEENKDPKTLFLKINQSAIEKFEMEFNRIGKPGLKFNAYKLHPAITPPLSVEEAIQQINSIYGGDHEQ